MILPGAAAIGYTILDRMLRLSLTLKIHMRKLCNPLHVDSKLLQILEEETGWVHDGHQTLYPHSG